MDDAHRGNGIGRRLLKAAKDWARKHRLETLQTSAWTANARTREFYREAGFTAVTERLESDLGS